MLSFNKGQKVRNRTLRVRHLRGMAGMHGNHLRAGHKGLHPALDRQDDGTVLRCLDIQARHLPEAPRRQARAQVQPMDPLWRQAAGCGNGHIRRLRLAPRHRTERQSLRRSS